MDKLETNLAAQPDQLSENPGFLRRELAHDLDDAAYAMSRHIGQLRESLFNRLRYGT
jgi:hypothetical protein